MRTNVCLQRSSSRTAAAPGYEAAGGALTAATNSCKNRKGYPSQTGPSDTCPASEAKFSSKLVNRTLATRSRSISVALLCTLSVLPASAASPADREDFTRDFRKTLTLPPGQAVRVDHRQGNIIVRAHAKRELNLQASIRVSAPNRDDAARFGDQVQIAVDQSASGVVIRTQYPEERSGLFSNRRNVSFSVNYDLAIPEDSPLTLRNSFGNVTVSGIKANSDITNAHGMLTFVDGRGSHRLENSFGGIDVTNNAGDITVTNSNSFVTVKQVKGLVTLKNRFGKVAVTEAGRGANIASSNGPVELIGASGPSTVTNSFGPVVVNQVGGDLSVNNNNGSIDVRAVAGAATLSTSFASVNFFDIGKRLSCVGSNGRISGTKVGEAATIRNSFGQVELKDVNGNVDIENSNGKIYAKDIRGSATLKTRFGEVEATGISGNAIVSNSNAAIKLTTVGGIVDVRGSFGAISVAKVSGNVKVVSGNSGVSVSDSGGETYIKTSFGTVRAERVGGTLTVENTNGSVQAASVKGAVSIRTSFASVNVDGASSGVEVYNGNGSIEVAGLIPKSAGQQCGPFILKTSFAPLRVFLPEGVGFKVTARTSFGKVNSEIPLTVIGSLGGNSLSGRIGNGECELNLTNTNGSIDILKAVSKRTP
jgi:hypothetical protein